jgi:apolipoprotein N-acyltransferase
MNNLKKFLIPSSLGAFAAFAFTPTYFILALFVSFPALLFLISKSESYKQTFFIGWSFGFGFFLHGLYWISYALLVDENLFGWLVPFAVTLIPATLAIYIGITALVAHPIRKDPLRLILCFTSSWVLIEILRTSLFTGFPWLALGYSLGAWLPMVQSASLFGVFGLSMLILLVSTSPFLLLARTNRKVFFTYAFVCIFLSISNFTYGVWKLETNKTTFHPQKIRIVQPNIKQDLKWNKNHRYANLQKLISLSKSKTNPTYIIWPESALTFSIEDPKVKDLLTPIIPPNSFLLTGAINYKSSLNKIYVSLLAINSNGVLKASYDKKHLVPFGEYIPFKDIIPGIHKLTHGLMDFSKGAAEQNIISSINGPSFRTLICYEAFFPSEILEKTKRPDFLLNIINDAWYRDSSGPFQHLEMAQFRAIENGLPMVRVANTGISAILGPQGRIIEKLPLNKEGYLESFLPKKNLDLTAYSLYGNNILTFLLLSILVAFLPRNSFKYT